MRRVAGMILGFAMTASSVAADPAQVTANVNLRAGPGTGNAVLQTIPDGTTVEFLECNDAGSWCAIEYQGQTGFVSGQYLVQSPAEETARWPRAFGLEGDSFIVLYEPQFSGWEDFRHLNAVVAAEFREAEEAEPIFGVIGLRGETALNREDSTVVITDLEVTQVDFAALDRSNIAKLSVGVGQLLPTEPITLAEERIVAGLANFEQVSDVEGLKADPPAIFVSNSPARLVQTDGSAIFAPVQGAPGVEFLVNTNWDIFRVDGAMWLRDEASWLTNAALDGEWAEAMTLDPALSALPDDGNWTEAREALTPVAYDEGAPKYFHSDTPAELIIFDGSPEFQDVPGGDLEWAENSEADIFRLKSTGDIYYLVSGRWFSAPSLDGPWTFATPSLPSDFLNIPDDVPYYTVRASVPGTSEANEARLRAAIPEVARVSLADLTAPEVSYDGDPVFEAIDGTDLSYATNTQAQVIEVQGQYYLVTDGIWFVSDTANGPWTPATEVPEAIYDIPPASPVHNVTYVRIYEHDEDENEVLTGYTAGYLHGFLAWGVFVYGSGWDYPPYWHHGHYPIYYPRPYSYGGASYYNPARGTFGRYGYSYGPYRGIQARTAWNPRTGTYARGARAYGPRGTSGFVHAFNPRTGSGLVARGGKSIYGKWGAGAVRQGPDYLRAKGAKRTAGGKGVKWDSSRGSGFAVSGRRGNTYAGRDGNVYRKTGNSWQRWEKGAGWEGVKAPKKANLKGQGQRTTAKTRKAVKTQPRTTQRATTARRAPAGVGREESVRRRANQMSHQSRSTKQRARTQATTRRAAPKTRTRSRAAPQRARRSSGGKRHGGGRRRR